MDKSPNFDIGEEVLRDDIARLCSVFSVSGFEYRASDRIKELYGEYFDKIICDAVGNHLLIKYSRKENPKKIMIDTHFDEIGFVVSEVLDGGFLRIASAGGIDVAIMQAADVCVYGEHELFGVVASVPPHLRGASEGELPNIDDLIVDMGGYTKHELETIAPVGTPVGFALGCFCFGEGYMAGKSFDNKACGAIALRAITDTPAQALAADVCLCLSAREESARFGGGVQSAAFSYRPDYAMVIDVNLGNAPDVPKRETVGLKDGVSITFSAATDRELTRETERLCKESQIAYTRCAAPSSTGTNATALNLVREGVPVVDVGLPLRNMHTYNEVLCLDDAKSLYALVKSFICSDDIAERFKKESVL